MTERILFSRQERETEKEREGERVLRERSSLCTFLIADSQSEKMAKSLSDWAQDCKVPKIARVSPRAELPLTLKAVIFIPSGHLTPKAAAHLPLSGKKEASVHRMKSPRLLASR